MVGHAGQARVHIATTQVFGAHHLARSGFDQRWATQKDGALVLDDDGLVAHGRHIRAARSARAHDHRDLRDALRTHIGLVEKDATEVVAIRKDLVLVGQIGAARVHQINAGQVVLLRNLLRTQMLLHRHGIVGAALHCGIVADDHAVHPADTANAHDHARARRVVVVHVEGRQGRDFQKGRAGVEQHLHTVTRQQLATGCVLGSGGFATALGHALQVGTQVIDHGLHGSGVGRKFGRAGVELGVQNGHGASSGIACSRQHKGMHPRPASQLGCKSCQNTA